MMEEASVLLSRLELSRIAAAVAGRNGSIIDVPSVAAESRHEGWSEAAVRGGPMVVVVSTVQIVSVVAVAVLVEVACWQAVIEVSGTHAQGGKRLGGTRWKGGDSDCDRSRGVLLPVMDFDLGLNRSGGKVKMGRHIIYRGQAYRGEMV